MKALEEGMRDIAAAIKRNNGQFVVAPTPSTPLSKKSFTLAVGARNAVTINGGFIVVLGLSREQLVELRATCDLLLDGSSS